MSTTIESIIRDACECERPEKHDTDTVELRVSDLRLILLRHLPAALRAAPVTLTALNLRNALDFVAPDFESDEDQRESEVTIGWAPDRMSTENEPLAAGYYCWLTDYPEEGCIPLDQGEWHPPGTTTEERPSAQAEKPVTLAAADEDMELDSYEIDGQAN